MNRLSAECRCVKITRYGCEEDIIECSSCKQLYDNTGVPSTGHRGSATDNERQDKVPVVQPKES